MGTFDLRYWKVSMTRYWKRRMYSRGERRAVFPETVGTPEYRLMKRDGLRRRREHQAMKRLRRLRAPSIFSVLYREGAR